MARVLFASNEAPRPREKRIFAVTNSYRADSMASPLGYARSGPASSIHVGRARTHRIRPILIYAAAIRSTLIFFSRWRDWARSKANCMPSHVSGVEPNAFDSR